MSKSLGNVLLVHELLKSQPGEVLRLALLSAHYRQPLDWSDDTVAAARRMLDRLYGALRGVAIARNGKQPGRPAQAVMDALDDDLNTPKAIAELFNLARTVNKETDDERRGALAAELLASGQLLGLLSADPEDWFTVRSEAGMPAAEIEAMLRQRDEARAARDFAAADSIRDRLAAAGVVIEDGPDGTRWRRGG